MSQAGERRNKIKEDFIKVSINETEKGEISVTSFLIL